MNDDGRGQIGAMALIFVCMETTTMTITAFNLELLLLSRIIVTLETLAVLLTCNGKKLWMSINTWLDFCSCSLDTAWNCLFLSSHSPAPFWWLLARRKFSCRSNLFFFYFILLFFWEERKVKQKIFGHISKSSSEQVFMRLWCSHKLVRARKRFESTSLWYLSEQILYLFPSSSPLLYSPPGSTQIYCNDDLADSRHLVANKN